MALDPSKIGAPGGPRAHRRFKAGTNTFAKVPKSIGASDDNVCFGLGSNVHGAPGAGFVLDSPVSREMFLRDLVISTGGVRGRVSAITAAGDALLQGDTVPIEMFGSTNPSRPNFDIPVYTGTISVTYGVDAPATVDAGFNID